MSNDVYDDGSKTDFGPDERPPTSDKSQTGYGQDELDRLTGNTARSANRLRRSVGADKSSKADTARRIGDEKGASKIGGGREGDAGYPYRQEAPGGFAGFRGRAKGFFKKHKYAAVAGIGSGGILILLVFFMLAIGSLIIPNFATHIEEFELSRVLRTFSERNVSITAEKDAADAANQKLSARIKNTYKNLRDNTWGRFDKFRPAKIIANLKSTGRLKYNYKVGPFGRQGPLESLTFEGTTHDLNGSTFFNTFHPVESFQQGVKAAQDFGTALNASLRDKDGIGLIVRGAVENKIRKELGISLIAWVVGRYQGKNAADGADQQAKDAFNATNDSAGSGQDPGALGSTESTAASDVATCAQDNKCLENLPTNGSGIPQQAAQDIVKGIDGSLMGRIVKFLESLVNPAIGILFQVCMINAGSMVNSKPSIDAQDAELQRTFYYIASAGDQQKSGSPQASPEAIRAMANKINGTGSDLAHTDAELKAGGQTIDTSSYISPQASKAGQFNDTNIIGVLTAPIIGKVATHACNAFLSPGGQALSTVAGIIAAVGGDEILDGLGGVIKEIQANLVNQFTTKAGLRQFIGTTLRDGTIAIGGALLAKLIVINSTGALHSGLQSGLTYDNDATAGGDLNNGEVMQKEFYGVPMNDTHTAQIDSEDNNFVRSQIDSESVGNRYFSITNPDSLISHIGMNLYGAIYGKQLFQSILNIAAKIFNPMVTIPKIFSVFDSRAVLAASAQDTSADQHFGMVQWGNPPNEENLINGPNRTSYQMLENAQVFMQEWNDYHQRTGGDLEADIENKYGACFSDSMGVLLSNGMIVREANGNVLESAGLCSESQLGPSNAFDGEPQSVFRWRLMHSYNAAIDNLIQAQGV